MQRLHIRTSTQPHAHAPADTPRHPHTHTRPLIAAIALGISLLVLSGGRAEAIEANVVLADGRTLEKANLLPGAGADQIVLEQAGKPTVTASIRDLLTVDFGRVPTQPLAATLRLANGDQVYGKLSFPASRQVRIATGWGVLTAPLPWCSTIRVKEQAEAPTAAAKDTLLLENDRVQGEIQSFAAGKVTVDVGGTLVPVDLGRVQAITLAGRSRGPADRSGLRLSVDLGGGERLSGKWVKITPDVLTMQLDWGTPLDVPLASIARLDIKNGKVVYLSDLAPTEAREIPYLEGTHPFQIDRAVSGRPLRLGGKVYRRGVGVHSRSELTYALDGGYQFFTSMLGLDDAVGAQGSVIYRVYGDDKLLFESPILRGGDTPAEIKVPIKGVLLLRLEVDYADNGDAADHANWADARLVRE